VLLLPPSPRKEFGRKYKYFAAPDKELPERPVLNYRYG
jgi:hypothetical protein